MRERIPDIERLPQSTIMGPVVPVATSAEEAFDKLFERVRNIENMMEEISKRG